MDRTILHCDMNSFFASVELLAYPDLRDKPVAVSGNPRDRHGIILAKNEHAKKFGVRTAETIWQARKKCPDLVLLPPHHERYDELCQVINAIYLRYTDLVEPFSIDESWLDVTGSLGHFGLTGKALADQIRRVVKKETGLTLSAGVSYNKIFAKMGSDYKKPDATTVIDRENYKDILWPLPAGELMFVGTSTMEKLKRMNITTIGGIATADINRLRSAFGKHGEKLYEYANGLDSEPVAPYSQGRQYKSVGNGITFRRNLLGRGDVRTAITALSDRVASRLRSHNLKCTGVKVDIKDPEFRVISRQLQLDGATDISKVIAEAAMSIMDRNWRFTEPIRLLTVTGINLTEGDPEEQLSIFGDTTGADLKQRAVDSALDHIRGKFGKYSIVYGGLLNNDLGISYREDEREEVQYEEE